MWPLTSAIISRILKEKWEYHILGTATIEINERLQTFCHLGLDLDEVYGN